MLHSWKSIFWLPQSQAEYLEKAGGGEAFYFEFVNGIEMTDYAKDYTADELMVCRLARQLNDDSIMLNGTVSFHSRVCGNVGAPDARAGIDVVAGAVGVEPHSPAPYSATH